MSSPLQLLRHTLPQIWEICRSFGERRFVLVGIISVLQVLFQLAAVASIFPFLSLASGQDLPPWAPHWLTGSESSSPDLSRLGTIVIVLQLLAALTGFLGDYSRSYFAHETIHQMASRLMERVAARSYLEHLRSSSSTLVKRLRDDLQVFLLNVLLPFLDAFVRITSAGAILAALLILQTKMTFIVGAVFAAAYGITLIALRGILARCNQEHHGLVERQLRAASEFLHHFKVILLYRAQPVFIRSYQEASRALAANEAPVPVIRATPRLIMEAIAFSSLIAFVLWALRNPHSSPELIPLVGTYVMAGYRLLPSFSLVYSQVVNVLSKTTVTNTLHNELFSAHPPTPSDGGNAASRLHEQIPFPNRIDFQQVTFRYSGEGQSTLENIDFHLHAGEHLGIQGPSGSGKSTFADLLLGLLPPSDGAILHDGKPWHGSSAETQWWPHLGYVPQQIALLDDTLQQNITLGAPVDQDRLEEVLCRTQLKDWFHSLERGWDHPVGEGGAHVSGGQRQRIALARALYRDPKLLILDEATSALDPETETSLLETLHQSCPRGTILTIAHRPNALRHCDRIYEMSQGKLHLLTSAS